MRTIPPLSVLCLRVVGSKRCSAEETFAKVPENSKRRSSAASGSKETDKSRTAVVAPTDENDDKEPTATKTSADEEGTAHGAENNDGEHDKAPSKKVNDDIVKGGEGKLAVVPDVLPHRKSVLPVDTIKKVPSTATRLLDSFHTRGTVTTTEEADDEDEASNAIDRIPIERTNIFSARRRNANDIDLNHPWIGVYLSDGQTPLPPPRRRTDDSGEGDDVGGGGSSSGGSSLPVVPLNPQNMEFVSEYSTPALDVLQLYVDALVEMGRMDDSRLGLHFFQQVKRTIELSEADDGAEDDDTHHDETDRDDAEGSQDADSSSPSPTTPSRRKSRKRKSSAGSSWSKRKKKRQQQKEEEQHAAQLTAVPSTLASFSMHNAVILDETLQAMTDSKVLPHIAVLDLTGISTLTDDMLLTIVSQCGVNLRRLSIKNCRRLTNACLSHLANCCSEHLTALDIGGAYNISPDAVLDAITPAVVKKGRWEYPTNPLPLLVELHASGLNWGDEHLAILFSLRPWRGISLGFSHQLSFPGFKDAMLDEKSQPMCDTLQSLALPFCENLVTNAWLGFMGRHMPHIRALDVRGNNQLTSLTGWYDGRATIHDQKVAPMDQSLVVLARYSGITKASYESTLLDIPEAASRLTVVLDSGGVGLGVLRMKAKHGPVQSKGNDAALEGDDDVTMEG